MRPNVARAVSACYEATLAPETWADALHDFARSIDAVGCLFWPQEGVPAVVDLPISPDLSDVLADFVAGGWHLRDHRSDRSWPLFASGHTVLIDHDVTSEEERRRGAFHQEWCRSWGLPGWAGVGFSVNGDHWVMPILRAAEQGDFTPSDASRLAELSPHFARMVGFAEKLALGQASAGLDMLDRVACAAVLLDWRG